MPHPPLPTALVGQGNFRYQANARWADLPTGYSWQEVAAAACNSRGEVYVFNRGEHPVIVFDGQGRFLRSWGEGMFQRPHGITIGPDDAVYCTDDFGHVVKKFSPDGKLLLALGGGRPSDTGATSVDFRTIQRAGPPFHYPTNVALAPDGAIYVSDGYGNARVHKFDARGRLLHSWGAPGGGRGEFRIPHGIAVDKNGTVYVADRENSRLVLYGPEGEWLADWTDVARPCQAAIDAAGNVYVAELGFRAGMWPGTSPPSVDAPGGRVSIFSPRGELLCRFGGGANPAAAGDFYAPHDICLDADGNMYVAEVVWSAGGCRGLAPPGCHALQKFTRQP